MLSAPSVVAPLSPCCKGVHVSGTVPDGTVEIIVGSTQLGKGPSSSGDTYVPLLPGAQLFEHDIVVARQFTASDSSDKSRDGVGVLAEPTRDDLNGIYCPESLLECGTSLWLSGIEPGATVSLNINSASPLTIEAISDSTKFVLPTGDKLHTTDIIFAQQTACGIAGNPVQLLAPLSQIRKGWTADAPAVLLPLFKCQASLELNGILPGAEVVITLDGREYRAPFALSKGFFNLPRKLNIGDYLSIRQEFRFCELSSGTDRHRVEEDKPDPPSLPGPICEGDFQVVVTATLRHALLQFRADDDSDILCTAGASEDQRPINVPSLIGRRALFVRQSICNGEDGTWSDWSYPCPITLLGPQSQPRIQGHIFDEGMAVGVTGLEKGTTVKVVSIHYKGVIGSAIANGDERIDVYLWKKLFRSDVVSLRTLRCGVDSDWGQFTPVEQTRDIPPPRIADPVCDCGGSVLVNDVVPGAIVDLLKLDAASGLYLPVGTRCAGIGEASVDVPPLKAGDVLAARQRMMSKTSGQGPAGTTSKESVCDYVNNSTFRLCQLTQDWEPTPRPHPANTSSIGLTGTDLGIPIEHKGRLYLFFGDCLPTDGNAADGDPIAFTTLSDSDNLQNQAPDMYWIVGDDGQFRRVIVEAVSMGNFEVPTGGFSYDGKLYLFVGSWKREGPDRMTASFLASTEDPHQDFGLLQGISSTVGDKMLPPLPDKPFPGGRWMLHISPTVIRNSDWPWLPSSSGDGLLMFGSSIYRGIPAEDLTAMETATSNVYLAWAPLTPGTIYPSSPIPEASEWHFLTGFAGPGGFIPLWGKIGGGRDPLPVLPPDYAGPPPTPRLLGEISVYYAAVLRRWILSGSVQGRVNIARYPWGPWTTSREIANPAIPGKDAGNTTPGQEWTRKKVTYAPYLIPRWTKWDRSTRKFRVFYTLSVFDQPEQEQYQPQLMRSVMQCR